METELFCNLIVESKRIVVFTGAGVSLESGVDLRTLWSEGDLFDLSSQDFLRGPESRKKQWRMLRENEHIIEAVPNQTHYTLAEMDRMGKLDSVITENSDNLLQRAGVSQSKIIELYGNLNWAKCPPCGRRFSMKDALEKARRGIEVPACPDCFGPLEPDAALFPEEVSEEAVRAAIERSKDCDLFISLGSSLATYPPAYLVGYAKTMGAMLIIVSVTPTIFDKDAVLVIHEGPAETTARVMEKLRERIP
jgi:NAD-dependent deacetylase